MGGDLVILDDDLLLRKLSLLIYRQESLAIHNIQFKSEPERVKYLRACKSNHDAVISILDDAVNSKEKFKKIDEAKASIAHNVYTYSVKGVNAALQTVRNYSLRVDYLKKIKEHARQLLVAVNEVDSKVVDRVESLAKEAMEYKEVMSRYLAKYQSGASKVFSRLIKQKGMRFEDLVKKYQFELKFKGNFKDLEDGKKLQVYNRIIKASGRGEIVPKVLDRTFAGIGIAVLLFTLGIMVWDIFSSEHPIQTATQNAVTLVAAVGGAVIGMVVRTAVATVIADTVKGSAVFVMMAGFISSLIGAFVISAVAGVLVGLIFGSGGGASLGAYEGEHCYVAPLPDGAALARQIVHNHNKSRAQ